MNNKEKTYRVKPSFKQGAKKDHKYIDIDTLIQDKPQTFCEVFYPDDMVKYFIDVDKKKVKSKDEYNIFRNKVLKEYYPTILEKFTEFYTHETYVGNIDDLDFAISDCSYYNSDEDNKISFHFVSIGCSCRYKDMKFILLEIYPDIFKLDGIDPNVYTTNSKTGGMRAIYNQKTGTSNDPLIPINYKNNLEKHIIQHIYDGFTDYNISYYLENHENNEKFENNIAEKIDDERNANSKIYKLDEYEKRCLYLIDYNKYYSWIRVASILKGLKCSPMVFYKWSSQYKNYKRLENEKLWNSIKDIKINIGSLYWLASSADYGNPYKYKEITEKMKNKKSQIKDKNIYKYCIPEANLKKLIEHIGEDVKYDKDDIDSIINASTYDLKSEIINYYKYKPILENVIKPDLVVNQPKLDLMKDGECLENFIIKYAPDEKYVIIKSDTGTGKSTCVNNYFNMTESTTHKIISITSRVSLAEAHYNILQKGGKRIRIYNQDELASMDNIIVQLDSIVSKLVYQMKYENYTLYLDEFSSILEYLHMSSTLNKHRVLVYKKFIHIIKQVKKVVMVDADIDDICIEWIDKIRGSNERIFINNTYLNNKDVISEEIDRYDDTIEKMIDDMKNSNGFCCCCDSKNVAQDIYNLVLKDNADYKEQVLLITDEFQGFIDLDAYKCVIYSPKVIYGIDSTKVRNVYCIYKEHTISPRAMYQQISRTRNIKKLFLYFNKKTFNYSWFRNLKDVEDEIEMVDKYTTEVAFFDYEDQQLKSLFKDTYKKYIYNNEAYNTNKFCHNYLILLDKGVKCDDTIKITKKKLFLEYQKAHQKLKAENFDVNNYYVQKQNAKYMKMTSEEILKYQEYYLVPQLLDGHFLYCKFFIKNKSDFITGLKKIKDFNINKASNSKVKLYFLDKIQQLYKLSRKEFKIDPKMDYNIDYSDLKDLDREYKIIFKSKCRATFTNREDVNALIPRMMRSIFGTNCLKSKRINKGSSKITVYEWNEEYEQKNNDMHNIRTNLYIERRKQEKKENIEILPFKDPEADMFIESDDEEEEEPKNLLDAVICDL